MTTQNLYSFNWLQGGFNHTYASSFAEAGVKAEAFGKKCNGLTPDPKSFVKWSKKTEDEYYRRLPLMD